MCLTKFKMPWHLISKPKFKVAEKDIEVYKILLKSRKTNVYISPCQWSKYELNVLNKSEIGKLESSGVFYEIEKGLHSFYNYKSAKNSYLMEWDWDNYESIILLSVIPKGSLYMKGTKGEIVSNQLIVTDKIV